MQKGSCYEKSFRLAVGRFVYAAGHRLCGRSFAVYRSFHRLFTGQLLAALCRGGGSPACHGPGGVRHSPKKTVCSRGQPVGPYGAGGGLFGRGIGCTAVSARLCFVHTHRSCAFAAGHSGLSDPIGRVAQGRPCRSPGAQRTVGHWGVCIAVSIGSHAVYASPKQHCACGQHAALAFGFGGTSVCHRVLASGVSAGQRQRPQTVCCRAGCISAVQLPGRGVAFGARGCAPCCCCAPGRIPKSRETLPLP